MKAMMLDVTAWLYFFNFGLCFLSFVAFVWYWKEKGHGGDLYKMITYLFGVNALERGLGFFARSQKSLNHDFYHTILDSAVWWLREVFVLIVLIMIVFKIYKRIITNKK